MERTYIVEESLFGDIFEDAIILLADKSGEEIPKWRSYELDFANYIHPVRTYHIILYEGPSESPGKVVAYALIDIFIEEEKEKKQKFL